MATQRTDPYAGFNFRVEIDGITSAAFSEVSGLGAEIDVIDYREGGDRVNSRRKLPGLHKVSNVTLKRGVTGDTSLFAWLRATAQGAPDRVRNVSIILLDELHQPVVTWRLVGAWPVKWEGPVLKAGCSEAAIEALTLTVDRIEIE